MEGLWEEETDGPTASIGRDEWRKAKPIKPPNLIFRRNFRSEASRGNDWMGVTNAAVVAAVLAAAAVETVVAKTQPL